MTQLGHSRQHRSLVTERHSSERERGERSWCVAQASQAWSFLQTLENQSFQESSSAETDPSSGSLALHILQQLERRNLLLFLTPDLMAFA